MKNVLVIADYFPPLGGIGATRIVSFMRHLGRYGWNAKVVTIDWNPSHGVWIDDSLLSPELQDRVLFRSREPNMRREKGRIPPLLTPQAICLDPLAAACQIRDRLFHAGRPNGSWFFIRAARRFLKKHLQAEHYDVILSTSPDFAPHRIACQVAEDYRMPWVADCRDDIAVIRKNPGIYVELERRHLKSASAVTTVSQGVAEALEERLGRRVTVITNGFEERRLEGSDAARSFLSKEVLNIVYTGMLAKFYPERDPQVLFEGMESLFKRRPELRRRIVVHFFGDADLQPLLDSLVARYPSLKEAVKDHGRIPMRDALEVQCRSDFLLLLSHGRGKGILSGKMFEYMGARRPIICVPGDDGEQEAFLQRTKAGVVLKTAGDSAAYLETLFEQWKCSGAIDYECNEEEVAQYGRANLTGRLASILDEVSQQRCAASGS